MGSDVFWAYGVQDQGDTIPPSIDTGEGKVWVIPVDDAPSGSSWGEKAIYKGNYEHTPSRFGPKKREAYIVFGARDTGTGVSKLKIESITRKYSYLHDPVSNYPIQSADQIVSIVPDIISCGYTAGSGNTRYIARITLPAIAATYDGVWELSLKAVDATGNVSTAAAKVLIGYDAHPPTVTGDRVIFSGQSGTKDGRYWYKANDTITLQYAPEANINEDGCDGDEALDLPPTRGAIRWKVNTPNTWGWANDNVYAVPSPDRTIYTHTVDDAVAEGTLDIPVYVSDDVGNELAALSYYYGVDKTAPVNPAGFFRLHSYSSSSFGCQTDITVTKARDTLSNGSTGSGIKEFVFRFFDPYGYITRFSVSSSTPRGIYYNGSSQSQYDLSYTITGNQSYSVTVRVSKSDGTAFANLLDSGGNYWRFNNFFIFSPNVTVSANNYSSYPSFQIKAVDFAGNESEYVQGYYGGEIY